MLKRGQPGSRRPACQMTKLIMAGRSDSVEHERDPTAETPWSSRAGLPRHPGPYEMTRFPAFLARVGGCHLALGMLAAFVFGLSTLWHAVIPPGKCTNVVLDRLPSPGGSWVAVTDEDICDVGSFSTDITAGVNLVSTIPPLRDIVVLGVDTGGNDNERPLVAWSAPDVLRVTMGLRSILKVLTRQVEGVRVNVQFDPDDPPARAAWLKQTGLPDDEVDNGGTQ